MPMSKEPRAYASVLAVRDLENTSQYFQDALGFVVDWRDGSNWHCLSRGTARVMLGRCPDSIPPAELGDHSYFAYLHCDDVNALYEELSASGAIIRHPPKDQPWGIREMAIATPDGHRLMVGQILDHHEPG